MYEFPVDKRFIYFMHPLHYRTKFSKAFAYNPQSLKITYNEWQNILLIIVNKIENCPICLSECIEPVVAPCYHQYCKTCIDLLIENNFSACSVCNMHIIIGSLKPVMPNEFLANINTTECYFKINCTLKAVNKTGKFKLKRKTKQHKIDILLTQDYSLILLKFVPINLDIVFYYINNLKKQRIIISENIKKMVIELRANKNKVNEVIRMFLNEFFKEGVISESFDFIRLDDFHIIDHFAKFILLSTIDFKHTNLPNFVEKKELIYNLTRPEIKHEYEDYCVGKKKSFDHNFIEILLLEKHEKVDNNSVKNHNKQKYNELMLIDNVCIIIIYNFMLLN